jgi:uncharacterized small protein (DUF1192 family)
MGFKDLFITGDDGDKKPEVKKEAPKTMPSSIPTGQTYVPTSMPTEIPTSTVNVDNGALAAVLTAVQETYRNGFNSLNRQGYDFFEYYQSIKSINGTNADSYKMAYTLGKSMNPSISPESLASDSEFYITEINKVFTQFESAGKAKALEIETQKNQSKMGLKGEIEATQSEISRLQAELEQKTAQLSNIDSQFDPVLSEVNLKLEANKIARNEIVSSIEEVANNIKNYLQ